MGLSMTEIKKAVKEVLSRFYSKERFKPVFKRTGRLLLVVVSILCIMTVLEVVVFRFLDSPVTVRVACSSLYHRVAGKHYKESLSEAGGDLPPPEKGSSGRRGSKILIPPWI
jgi:hypothetical protein